MRPLLLIAFLGLFTNCQKEDDPIDRQKILDSFEIMEGFDLELIAAEPLVADPVDMAIDFQGRMYVVEMHGYPLDKGGSGNVVLLKDSNDDGKPDQRIVFAEGLIFPTGIMPWKKGVIVTDPPDVIYFEDEDRDGHADTKQVLLTGFSLSNPQHNMNNPVFGLDNWIYLGHEGEVTPNIYKVEFGDDGSEVIFPGNPESPTLPRNAEGKNVRFRPDTYELEMLSAETQFGQTFGPYGRHVLSSNYYYMFTEAIAARYLSRNPDLVVSDPTAYMPDYGEGIEIFPITRDPEHQLLTDVGVITSGCGVTWYQGGLFPEPYDRMVFNAEPVHNLIHTDVIYENGSVLAAKRHLEDKQFLASRDSWFRPSNFYVGPDGALYMVDYYRQYIEHPEWMSEEIVASGDLYNGSDMGRIFRIIPSGRQVPINSDFDLWGMDPENLVELLGHANRWWRMAAQQVLYHRQDKEIIPVLIESGGQTENPLELLHILYTLDGLGHFNIDLIHRALNHPEAGLRENAVKLIEKHRNELDDPLKLLISLENDPSPRVRYQLLCTLGFFEDSRSREVIKRLLVKDLPDKWVQIAALSGNSGEEIDLLKTVISGTTAHKQSQGEFMERTVNVIVNRGGKEEIEDLFSMLREQRLSEELTTSLLNGMSGSGDIAELSEEEDLAFLKVYISEDTDAELRSACIDFLHKTGYLNNADPDFENRIQAIAQDDVSVSFKADAIRILGLIDPEGNFRLFKGIIQPEYPVQVQKEALGAIGRLEGMKGPEWVIEHWSSLTPGLRDAALDMFRGQKDKLDLLLSAIENGVIEPAAIGWRGKVYLMNYHDESIRSKARDLLEGNETAAMVLERRTNVLTLEGDPENGDAVYQKACAQCHQMKGKLGTEVGPDLAGVRNRTKKSILRDIVDPNFSIADGYEQWKVTLRDGNTLLGIITEESVSGITVTDIMGRQESFSRKDIEKIETMERSAMPEGLDQQMTDQELADLITYINNYRD